jgi:hypothetical protein
VFALVIMQQTKALSLISGVLARKRLKKGRFTRDAAAVVITAQLISQWSHVSSRLAQP